MLLASWFLVTDPYIFLSSEMAVLNVFISLRAFLVVQMVKKPHANARRHGCDPGLGRSPGGGHGNVFQYSCLENPHGQRSLAGYSLWGHKESHMTFASCSVQTCPKVLILKQHVTSLWSSSWESAFQCRGCRFDPWSGD